MVKKLFTMHLYGIKLRPNEKRKKNMAKRGGFCLQFKISLIGTNDFLPEDNTLGINWTSYLNVYKQTLCSSNIPFHKNK